MKEYGLGSCWLEVLHEYSIIDKIGEGSFGTVFMAECKSSKQYVAIKHIKDFAKNEHDCMMVLREIQIMRQINKLSDCCFTPELIDVIIPSNELSELKLKNLFMIMEYETSDLAKVIKNGVTASISQDNLKLIFYNLLCALKFLHSANILHRDIKPSNLLINKDC